MVSSHAADTAFDEARKPGAAISAPRGFDGRYRRLIHHMPTPLLQVDARSMGALFDKLQAEGVTDIGTHLAANPQIVEFGCDNVLVTEVNRAAVALFRGRNAEELIRPVRYLFEASMQTAQRIMIAHFEGCRNYSEQTQIRTFDGEIRDVVLSVTFPTPPERLDTTFLTIIDISERLDTEAQLRQLQAEHARAARMSTLGEMATSIAHEIRQPLAAIVTTGEASLRWLARDEVDVEKVKQLTSRMVTSALRASEIIQRVRRMATNDQPHYAPLNLFEVVKEALLFVRHDIESRSIAIVTRGVSSLPQVSGDRIQLQQVVVNLLVNSIQALGETGQAERRIDISLRADGDEVLFSIRDNGPGIATEDIARVFDSFFTRKEGGMGIGLAICQSIINAHGGAITADNHPTGGACFSIALPVAQTPET